MSSFALGLSVALMIASTSWASRYSGSFLDCAELSDLFGCVPADVVSGHRLGCHGAAALCEVFSERFLQNGAFSSSLRREFSYGGRSRDARNVGIFLHGGFGPGIRARLSCSDATPRGVPVWLPDGRRTRQEDNMTQFRCSAVRHLPQRGRESHMELRPAVVLAGLLLSLVVLLVGGCGVEQPAPPPEVASTATLVAIPTSTTEPTSTPSDPVADTTIDRYARTGGGGDSHARASPGTVLNLRVINVTQDTITLQWQPPANSDVVAAEQYEVIREASSGFGHHYVLETMLTDVDSKAHRIQLPIESSWCWRNQRVGTQHQSIDIIPISRNRTINHSM